MISNCAFGFSSCRIMKTVTYLGSGRVQVIQVCAAAATMESNHGRLESVILYPRVSVI